MEGCFRLKREANGGILLFTHLQDARPGAFMAKDLTKGNPLKIILLFSIPLAIGNACNQLYSMVDSMIVGRGAVRKSWPRSATPGP